MNIPHWSRSFIFLHLVIISCCQWSTVHGQEETLINKVSAANKNEKGFELSSDGCSNPIVPKSSQAKANLENVERLDEPVPDSSFRKTEAEIEKERQDKPVSRIGFRKPDDEFENARSNPEKKITGRKIFVAIWNGLKRAWNWFRSLFPKSTRKPEGTEELAPDAEQLLKNQNSGSDKTGIDPKDSNAHINQGGPPQVQDDLLKSQSETIEPNPQKVQPETDNLKPPNFQHQTTGTNVEIVQPQTTNANAGNIQPQTPNTNTAQVRPQTTNTNPGNVQPQTTTANVGKVQPQSTNTNTGRVQPQTTETKPVNFQPQTIDANAGKVQPKNTDTNLGNIQPQITDASPEIIQHQATSADPGTMQPQITNANGGKGQPHTTHNDPGKVQPHTTHNDPGKVQPQTNGANFEHVQAQTNGANFQHVQPQITDSKPENVQNQATSTDTGNIQPQITNADGGKVQPQTSHTNSGNIQPKPEEVQHGHSEFNHKPVKDLNTIQENNLGNLDKFWQIKAEKFQIPLDRMVGTAGLMELLFEGFRHGKDPSTVIVESTNPFLKSLGMGEWTAVRFYISYFSNKIKSQLPKGIKLKSEINENGSRSWQQLINQEKNYEKLNKAFISTLQESDGFVVKLQASGYHGRDPQVFLDHLRRYVNESRLKDP